MSFSEIQLAQEAATNIEVSPSGKIINGNDGLTVVSSQKALPTVPKIAQGKTKGGLNRKSSIYNAGPDPGPENQSNRKDKNDKNGSNNNETAGAGVGTGSGSGSENQGQGQQNRRKMSKLKTVKSSKKLAKSMSKTTRSAKNSKSRSKTNRPGPAGQHRGVSTGGKSKVLLSPNPQNSNNNGSGSLQPAMGSSDLSGTGTETATTTTNGSGTFSSTIPHPTVQKKSTSKGELLNILKSKSISSMSKTAPKSKSKSNTINNIRDTRMIRGKSPKSGNNNPSPNNKIQTQLPKHTDKDIRNKNNNLTKKNSGPPPAVFTTITPAFFSRLKQIAINEGNSKSKSPNIGKDVKDHSIGKSDTNSNSKHTNKKDKQSRSRSSRSTISFNDAREALCLKQQDVVSTVVPGETSAVRNNGGGAVETLKTKVNLPSKQHYNMSQSQSGSPRNAKEFVSNNSLQYSQTRISSSAGAGSGSGRNSGKPILATCHGTGCHSTTFPMKKHIRFADSDGNANHEDNHYLEMSSSYSNNTKMQSSNLMGGCLK